MDLVVDFSSIILGSYLGWIGVDKGDIMLAILGYDFPLFLLYPVSLVLLPSCSIITVHAMTKI